MPGRMAAVAMFIAVGLISCTSEPVAPPAPTPTAEGPSQTPDEAKRDGVPAAVAAMTLSARTDLYEIESPSITSDEGVWRLARPGVVPEYGEVLLLDERRERILKAFPLPRVPPRLLVLTKDAVFCGRQGDGGLPNSMVCRIDRQSQEMIVHVFWWNREPDPSVRPAARPGWTITDDTLEIYDFVADDDGLWAKSYKKGWTRLDPKTLKVVARNVARPTATPSSTAG